MSGLSHFALALSLLGGSPAPQEVRPAAVAGAERCVDCHPQTVASYARTGMARALGPLERGELKGLAPVAAGETGLRYHFEESSRPAADGSVEAWIVETWSPPGGGVEDELRSSARVGFAIGAGILDRSYAAVHHGRLWFAPLEVLSATGGEPRRAALAPGHMAEPGLRFTSPIAEECLSCHTDRLPPRDYPRNLVPTQRARWTPQGISCAACHGEVEAHATWREAELTGERPRGRDPVLSSGSLDLVQRLSVCARCHLQGDARIALRQGERGVPPPGGDFLQRWAVFVPAEPDDDVAFVSHVERLLASPCFLRSLDRAGRQMSCESCHDPHRSLADPRERARVRGACLDCHAAFESSTERRACSLPRAERGERDCVDCHMRRSDVFDVAHVQVHDHRILREPGPSERYEELRIRHSTDGRLKVFAWPGAPAPDYAGDSGLALMAALIAGFPEQAARYLHGTPAPQVRGLSTYQHLRGVLLERLGRDEDARDAYAAALRIDPEQVDSTLNLALVLGRFGDPGKALPLLDRVLERHPRADGALRNRALLRYATGDLAGFATDLQAAQALLPSAAVARALADYYRQRGPRELFEHWREEARRLAPHEAGAGR